MTKHIPTPKKLVSTPRLVNSVGTSRKSPLEGEEQLQASRSKIGSSPPASGWIATLLLFVYLGSAVLPTVARLLLDIAVMAFVLRAVWLARHRSNAGNPILTAIVSALVILYIFELFNTNTPSLTVGLTGLRKGIIAPIGLLLGAACTRECRRRFLLRMTDLLAASLALSILIHHIDPSLEQNINRKAGIYTALFASRPRLQGLFPGPFHVSLAASVVGLSALALLFFSTSRIRATLYLATALPALVAAGVRTGLITFALGYLLLTFRSLITNASVREPGRTRRGYGVVLLLALVVCILAINPPAYIRSQPVLSSLHGITSESRVVGRFAGYHQALSMAEQRPLAGYGPGSASDAMAADYVGHMNVTPHNDVLRYLVETGAVGGLLFLWLLLWCASEALRACSLEAALGSVACFSFIAFGLTGSAVEALPVSFFTMAMMGTLLTTSRPHLPSAKGNTRNPRS